MSVDGYGMTPEGFRIQRSEYITNIIFDDLEAKWGMVKRNPESAVGQIVNIVTKPYVRDWLEAEALYMATDVDSADDIALDNVCKYTNVKRKDKTSTSVICSAYGVNGTVIPEGSLVSDNSGNSYATVDEYTINSSVLVHAQLDMDDYENSISRSVTILSGGLQSTYADTASGTVFSTGFSSWVDSQIIAGLLPSGLFVEIIETGVNLISLGFLSFEVTAVTSITLEKIGSALIVENTTTGAIPASSGTVVNIVTTVTGFNEVYNWNNGITGNDIENDVILRIRRRRSKFIGSANTEAIENAIENNIDGIRTARCFENEEDIAVDGIKPHSVYIVVDGAEGKDQEIADLIWVKKCFGIGTNGLIEVTVVDKRGDPRIVKFDRARSVYGWVRVDITELEGDKTLPVDWSAQVKSNTSIVINNMSIGDDFISKKVGSGTYAVNGVLNAIIEVGTSTSPEIEPTNWVETSISLSKYEKILLGSKDNIIVTESI